MLNNKKVTIIGGGLAGSECAYQLAKRGFEVTLYEMKPTKFSAAHKEPTLAEIVCSNSLKSEVLTSSSGMLKAEMREFDSLILNVADKCRVPAGNALAVDREMFSKLVDEKIREFENIKIVNEEITKIPENGIVVVATGPLTSEKLAESIENLLGQDGLFFFDASAPIVSDESIDKTKAFVQDRYGDDGVGDYLNCPMNKEEYDIFYDALINANTVGLHDFEKNVFESCMPIEIMAKRGKESLRFGPMKPVGLYDKPNCRRPYSVVQLRKENVESNMYNLVGFQTNLTFPEQKKVFSLIPALENAEFEKYGVMHKNTYICSPKYLNDKFCLESNTNIYFAGQLSGVEGYMESTASGLMVALDIIARNLDVDYNFSCDTMMGALSNYISNRMNEKNFQPMNSNYGIIRPLTEIVKDKKMKRQYIYDRSLKEIKKIKEIIK